MAEIREVKILDSTANPAPLGLMGFGLTTTLLNIHNAGFYGLDSMIIGMGIFVGGLAQVIAGVLEAKKNNTFGTTAFTAYGFFWIALCAIWLLPRTSFGAGLSPNSTSMGWFLTMWGIFSLGMFIGTFKLSRVLQVIFALVVVLFFLLAIADFTECKSLKIIAGYEGILCGLSALYGSLAQVINEVYKKKVLPV